MQNSQKYYNRFCKPAHYPQQVDCGFNNIDIMGQAGIPEYPAGNDPDCQRGVDIFGIDCQKYNLAHKTFLQGRFANRHYCWFGRELIVAENVEKC